MHYGDCIYRLLMVFMLCSNIFFMFIAIKNDCYNQVMNDSVLFSFFPFIHDATPPVVSVYMLKSSTRRFVTSVGFSKAPSS